MPRLACWMIRAALLHLAVGALLGALILSAKGQPLLVGWAWRYLPAHIQLMVGGWMIQLTLGMGYWILPRLDGSGARGRTAWAWTSFACLNIGVVGTAVALLLMPVYSGAWLDALLVCSALLQVVALAAFAWHAWPRLAPITVPTAAQAAQKPVQQGV